MRPSARTVYGAIQAHWDSYGKPPTRQWLREYTGLSQSSIQAAIRHLSAANKIYAPKHESYIGLIRQAAVWALRQQIGVGAYLIRQGAQGDKARVIVDIGQQQDIR